MTTRVLQPNCFIYQQVFNYCDRREITLHAMFNSEVSKGFDLNQQVFS